MDNPLLDKPDEVKEYNPLLDKPDEIIQEHNPLLDIPEKPYNPLLAEPDKYVSQAPLVHPGLNPNAPTPFDKIMQTASDIGKAALDSPMGPAIKSVVGLTKKSLNYLDLDNTIKDMDLSKFTWTPAGEYYMNFANRLTEKLMPSTIINKFVPEEIKGINPTLKYSPAFIALAKASGGDLNKVNDKLWLGIGLDQMAFMGLEAIPEMLAAKPEEAIKNLVNISKMTPDDVLLMERELSKNYSMIENAENGSIVLSSSERISSKVKDFYNSKKVDMSPINKLVSDKPPEIHEVVDNMDNSRFTFEGTVYQFGNDGNPIPIKAASPMDIANQVNKETIMAMTDKMGQDIKEAKDFFPKEGQIDISPERYKKYGMAAYVMSPQTYAPVLFDQIGMRESIVSKLANNFYSNLKEFSHLQGTESSTKVFNYTDLPYQIARATELKKFDVAKNLGEKLKALTPTMTSEELRWANVHKEVMGKLADELGIPRQDSYVTHVLNDIVAQEYLPSETLQLDSKEISKRFLKERENFPGFKEDAAEVEKIYIDWAAKRLADGRMKTEMLQTIADMYKVDPKSARMAELYFHNYFGQTKNIPSWADTKDFLNHIAAYPTAAWLTGNLSPTLLNLTQAVLGGSGKIGYGPMARGIYYMNEIKKGSELGKQWEKILSDGAVLMQKSLDEVSPFKTIWEQIPGVGDLSLWGKSWLQKSENWGKGAIYLGAYDDAFTKYKMFKNNLEVNPKLSKRIGEWITEHGMKLDGDPETQSFLYARKATYDVHMDWTKAGQNYLAINPDTNFLYRFMTFPVKWSEYAIKNSAEASAAWINGAKELSKGNFNAAKIALRNPASKTVLRTMLNYSVLALAGKAVGVNFHKFTIEPFLAPWTQFAPIPRAILDFNNLVDQGNRHDPKFEEHVGRYISTMAGIPFQDLGWKVYHIIQTYMDNINNHSGKIWIRNPKDPRFGYETDGMHYIADIFTPAKDQNKIDYFENSKERNKLRAQANGLRQRFNNAAYAGEQNKMNELQKERNENKIKQQENMLNNYKYQRVK